MVDVDVHLTLFLHRDDRRIDHGSGGNLVPHVSAAARARPRVLGEVLRRWRIGFGDFRPHAVGEARLDGDVHRRDGDLLPRRAHYHADGLGIPPPVELPAAVEPVIAPLVHVEPGAHDHQFLHQLRKVRLELERQRDVGQRAAAPEDHFARVLADGVDHEIRGVLRHRLDGGASRREHRHFIRIVISAGVPGPLVSELAVHGFPQSGFLARIDQRELGALRDRDVPVTRQLQHPEGPLGTGLHLAVPGDDADADHLDAGGLQQHHERLIVRPGGAADVLIDEDLLLGAGTRRRHQHQAEASREHPFRATVNDHGGETLPNRPAEPRGCRRPGSPPRASRKADTGPARGNSSPGSHIRTRISARTAPAARI